jgi:hypothetical protein
VPDFDLGENETQLDFYLKRRAIGSGDELILTDRRLMVLTPDGEESYALDKLALVRTGFAFSTRAITRGIILIIIGLLIGWLLPRTDHMLTHYIQQSAQHSSADADDGPDVLASIATQVRRLYQPLRIVGILLIIYGVLRAIIGIFGKTSFVVGYSNGEMVYAVRGRDRELLRFGREAARHLQ